MKYLLAFLCPPVAVACTGRIYLALFNALFWPPSLCVMMLMLIKGLLVFGVPVPPLITGIAALSFFASIKWTSVIWLIPTIHALFIVHGQERDKRHAELLAAQKQNALMQKGMMRQLTQAAAQPRIVIVQQAPAAIPQPKAVHARQLPPAK